MQHTDGLAEGQSILCCHHKFRWGQNYPCLCSQLRSLPSPRSPPSPRNPAAAGLMMDPRSPLWDRQHLKSSFGHAMEKHPQVSLGKMEITCQGTHCIVLRVMSQLRLSTSIPTTLLARGCDSPHAPGAGLAGRVAGPHRAQGSPMGHRAFPQGTGHSHGAQGILTGHRASPRLHASMVVPVTQS